MTELACFPGLAQRRLRVLRLLRVFLRDSSGLRRRGAFGLVGAALRPRWRLTGLKEMLARKVMWRSARRLTRKLGRGRRLISRGPRRFVAFLRDSSGLRRRVAFGLVGRLAALRVTELRLRRVAG